MYRNKLFLGNIKKGRVQTMTELTAKQQLEALVAQERIEELRTLAQHIENDTQGRIHPEVTAHVVFLYSGTELVGSVASQAGWDLLIKLHNALNTPSEKELQEMEYQAQESPESRRNGYGAE